MNLQELKKALECDATKRNEEQAKTIKELHNKIKKLEDEANKREKLIGQLFNRCKVLSRGVLCMFCGCKDDCQSRK